MHKKNESTEEYAPIATLLIEILRWNNLIKLHILIERTHFHI